MRIQRDTILVRKFRFGKRFSDDSDETVSFADAAMYREWIAPSRRTQIAAVTLLTGSLYLLFAFLDVLTAPKDVLPLMLTFHLFLLPPSLFAISLLSFSQRRYALTKALLFIAPVGAALGNSVIVLHMADPAIYLTEIYLILFWTFTVSGLHLRTAAGSALGTVSISLLTAHYALELPQHHFLMHLFWMAAAFSFGLLGAFLLEN